MRFSVGWKKRDRMLTLGGELKRPSGAAGSCSVNFSALDAGVVYFESEPVKAEDNLFEDQTLP